MTRLRRADCSGPGITRRRAGRGFAYYDNEGERVDEREVLERIRELGIPPAWQDVWICPYPNGHLQATGVDAAGRKQYRYHDAWRMRRDAEKFDDMTRFARALPRLREHVEADLRGRRRAHPRARAGLRRAAARPRLLPHRHRGVHGHQRVLRAGHDAQGARDDRARRHDGLRLPGQERQAPHPGRRRPAGHRDRAARSSAAAAAARSCWPTSPAAAGATCARTTSTPTSRRPPATTSRPRTSAPGARPCIAALALAVSGPAQGAKTSRKRAITRAIKETSHYLGNTPAVCRASYIDPRIFDAYRGGLVLDQDVIHEALDAEPGDLPTHHPQIERAVLDLLNENEDSPRLENLAA